MDKIEKIITNDKFASILRMFFILYGSMMAPNIPIGFISLLKNSVVRIFIITIMLFTINKDLVFSMIVAILFIFSMKMVNKNEGFELISPKSHIYPGCLDVKIHQLITVFGDINNLEKTARSLGVPFNIEMNDENAPLIATFFVDAGICITDTCKSPIN